MRTRGWKLENGRVSQLSLLCLTYTVLTSITGSTVDLYHSGRCIIQPFVYSSQPPVTQIVLTSVTGSTM